MPLAIKNGIYFKLKQHASLLNALFFNILKNKKIRLLDNKPYRQMSTCKKN